MSKRLQMDAMRDEALAVRGLPEIAYRFESSVGIIAILRGAAGYRVPTDIPEGLTEDDMQRWVDARNRAMGVSAADAQAMFVGSAFGWNTPGADPKMHEAAT